MSPQIRDELLGDILVDVVSPHDMEVREKRARKLRRPQCARPYAAMTWVEAEPGILELRCPCGEVFPLSILGLSPWEPPPWARTPSDDSS
jgi:hypothetical protein